MLRVAHQVLLLVMVLSSSTLSALAQDDSESPILAQQLAAKRWITESALRADIQFLADDLLEGRQPGTRGDLLAQEYIKTQFRLAGLKPAMADDAGDTNDGWTQQVPLVGVTTQPPPTVTFQCKDDSLTLKNHDDCIVTSGLPSAQTIIDDAEVVFVGYGIQAPEYQWDDFKDVDVKGKVLLVMNNDPADDIDLFEGNRRLYYGRWDYKYAKAAEMGAAGMFIIHTSASAGYPFQVVQTSWTGEQMALDGISKGRLPMEGWLTEQASRKLVEFAGKNLDELLAAAESKDFKPVSLGTTVSLNMNNRVRQRTTANVLGLLPGADPVLQDQWLIITAHHDHIGISETRDDRGDNIYNGAVDNASGVAVMLSIARAMTSLPTEMRPKRSVLFASVGAEEQGLLGSEFLAENPPIPAGRLAAVINIDGVNVLGPTEDVVVIGKGKSDLDETVEHFAACRIESCSVIDFPTAATTIAATNSVWRRSASPVCTSAQARTLSANRQAGASNSCENGQIKSTIRRATSTIRTGILTAPFRMPS